MKVFKDVLKAFWMSFVDLLEWFRIIVIMVFVCVFAIAVCLGVMYVINSPILWIIESIKS